MKCRYCGAELAEDDLRCQVCGTEIQIVPDYNPLDDVLTDQVKGALSKTFEDREQRPNDQNHSAAERGRERVSSTTGKNTIDERARRRRQAERKRMLAKKRKQKIMIISAVAAVLLIVVGVVGYQNSYTGQVKKGYRLLENAEYEEAIVVFQKAIDKKEEKSDAYEGLASVYVEQKDLEKAEQVFLQVIKEQPDNLALYQAAIDFYISTNQESKIAYLLKECENDSIKKELEKYHSDVPEFSLSDEEVYDDVQALELTCNGKAIYYTTDKTDPTTSSTKYTEPIKLEEGETEVRAIAVNDEGIPSVIVSKTYTIEFPIADAPSVTPSTGQYDSEQLIRIVVPENYVAYYTTDGSTPKPGEAGTTQYTEPFSMPQGNTIFKAVLVDQKGRVSDVTTRNYDLVIEEE